MKNLNQSGVTLAECLIALAIIAVGSLSVFEVIGLLNMGTAMVNQKLILQTTLESDAMEIRRRDNATLPIKHCIIRVYDVERVVQSENRNAQMSECNRITLSRGQFMKIGWAIDFVKQSDLTFAGAAALKLPQFTDRPRVIRMKGIVRSGDNQYRYGLTTYKK